MIVKHFRPIFLAAVTASLAFTASLRAAIPPAENLLPADTLFLLSAPDFAAVRAAAKISPGWLFWNDPAMKPFHDKFMAQVERAVHRAAGARPRREAGRLRRPAAGPAHFRRHAKRLERQRRQPAARRDFAARREGKKRPAPDQHRRAPEKMDGGRQVHPHRDRARHRPFPSCRWPATMFPRRSPACSRKSSRCRNSARTRRRKSPARSSSASINRCSSSAIRSRPSSRSSRI